MPAVLVDSTAEKRGVRGFLKTYSPVRQSLAIRREMNLSLL